MLGDWVIFFLALLLVPVLLLEETSTDPGVVGAATVVNAVIWVLFVLDYAVDLLRAPDRGAHVRSHWWDLALIVVSPPLLAPPEAQALRVLGAAGCSRSSSPAACSSNGSSPRHSRRSPCLRLGDR